MEIAGIQKSAEVRTDFSVRQTPGAYTKKGNE